MQLENRTPFPALAFEGVDQHAQRFHVVALRQTLRWDAAGQLHFADEQAPLSDCAEPFEDGMGVRQESDLCTFKPRCDVLVNAQAHAPQGRAARQWSVRLSVRRPDRTAPVPAQPQGLNPFMPASPEATAQWKHEVARASAHPLPGAVLIDKTLRVCGPRELCAEFAPLRLVGQVLRLLSLGLIPSADWRLTAPTATTQVPLSLSHAFGGEALVQLKADDPSSSKVARRVPRAYRLQALGMQDGRPDPAPIAHEALEANPEGRGFLRAWHWQATRQHRLPAPQIEHPQHPLTAGLLQRMARARSLDKDDALRAQLSGLVASLGLRPAGHPARRALVGRVDQAFIDSGSPLPEDFDFGFWNAAWPDQQVDKLIGDEVIELTNLCAALTPGARSDAKGNTVLRLQLPRHTAQVLVRLQSGEMFMQPMRLDTLLVEPETQTLSMVWRIVLAQDEEAPIRLVEAHALDAQRTRELREDIERHLRILDEAPTHAPQAAAVQEFAHG